MMNNPTPKHEWLSQHPFPGKHLIRFQGDVLRFSLELSKTVDGTAWVRTTIGHGRTVRDEILREVAADQFRLGRGWFDIPMRQTGERRYEATLPLAEVGHFEAKCFFLKAGETRPVWPAGGNSIINVEPAQTCCANTVYNTFVRQFGPNKSRPQGGHRAAVPADVLNALDQQGYTVIPPSGTFRDLIAELDFIIGVLGCRYIQLLPIHPTPTTYARMGRFGSPYASLSFTAVDPALAVFDPRATPLEQFVELLDAIHARGAGIILDIAINHTGWAAGLHETHPEWLVRDDEGRIEAPGAWGVVWADLTRLDYTHEALWQYMADVFLTWCHRGVDGFRCDAAYMIPVQAWEFIIAAVRQQYPGTVFLLEGLGGKVSVTKELLNTANFNWAYSELFQNYTRDEIVAYLPGTFDIAAGEGLMVHFAETHDNPRLAARSQSWAAMRTALCALTSICGGFAFAGGVEWFATEKINVHEAMSLNWGAAENQTGRIKRLTTILKHHPAYFPEVELSLIPSVGGNQLVLRRRHTETQKQLLIVVNLDDQHGLDVEWALADTGMGAALFVDLLSGRQWHLEKKDGGRVSVNLNPGEVLCLTPDPSDLEDIIRAETGKPAVPERIVLQRAKAKVLDVITHFHGDGDIGDFDPDAAAAELLADPLACCRRHNPLSDESRVVTWWWPQDQRRHVMVPPGHFLLVRATRPFRGKIIMDNRTLRVEDSLPGRDGSYFGLFSPLPVPDDHRRGTLKVSVYTDGEAEHVEAPLFYLTAGVRAGVQHTFSASDHLHRPLLFLGTNGRGGMLRAHLEWGRLTSRYDALLAANMSADVPEDRRILFTRCRIWVVYQGYSQEIGQKNLRRFHLRDHQTGVWSYEVPTGQGEHVMLDIALAMLPSANDIRLTITRRRAEGRQAVLDDHKPVHLILRPDIEDRSFHAETKAYKGPERTWPAAVRPGKTSFVFSPDPYRHLRIEIRPGRFVPEPEWLYMVHRSEDRDRGFDPNSDLFSPGYFAADLPASSALVLAATAVPDQTLLRESPAVIQPPADSLGSRPAPVDKDDPFGSRLSAALDHFVVRRGSEKTVIAGYPWFLDWGRDTLIVTRGLIADGRGDDARKILKQFGRYETAGTLPNMIHGEQLDNRDTSDAPLWFLVACRDLVRREGEPAFLDERTGGRSIRQILASIGRAYRAGTPNGIRMDPDSGLIYSPSHFTWMDTDHPAGTPRQGYPVEIQALWYHAVSFLSEVDDGDSREEWRLLAGRVRQSLKTLYAIDGRGYLADCLHCSAGTPAVRAERDDALRPNQLFALTLGAIDEANAGKSILDACASLLVPGGIRSLADQPLARPLNIVRHGRNLVDPHHPYQGRYTGDEDTSRKPAYHNGTAWTWVFPSYCEAWVDVYGDAGKATAAALLSSTTRLLNSGCVGQVPEILDGDYPHHQRGCDAQAWGVSEALRVWKKIRP